MRGNKIFPGEFVAKHFIKIHCIKEHSWENLPEQKEIIALARKELGYSPTTAGMDIWRTIINNYEKHDPNDFAFDVSKINRDLSGFKTLKHLTSLFIISEERAEWLLEGQRWGWGIGRVVVCPFCGSTKKPYLVSGYSTNKYKCSNNGCYKKFNVRTGTFLADSKLPLQTWIAAIYLGDKVSSIQMAKELGISQKTAWGMQEKLGWANVPGRSSEIALIRHGKNPSAIELGRLGGLKGGPARASTLSPAKRREIARKGAQKRRGKSSITLWERVKRVFRAIGRGLLTVE